MGYDPAMSAAYDAIVIGGGHNGLTAAAYLARGGLRPLVLEARDVVGGAAVTEEIAPGYRCSTASYVVSLLRPEIVRDLELERHGYATIPLGSSFTVFADGGYLLLNGDAEHDRAEVGKVSNRDYGAIERFEAVLGAAGDVLRAEMLKPPPSLSLGGMGDVLHALRLGLAYRRMSADEQHRAVQLFTTGAQDIFERWFDSDAVRCKYASAVTAGSFVDLEAAGSAINLLHLTIGEVGGVRGAWAFVRGGMGAITQDMAAAAREHGAEIRTNAPVEKVILRDGPAVGVRLADGTEITARVVLANTDPKRTFLGLVGAENLDADFVADITAYKMESASFRMTLALSGVPEFAARPGREVGEEHCGTMVLMPEWRDVKALYGIARSGEIPEAPILDVQMPSALDDSLAPAGCHVMTMLCQHYPDRLAGGRSWDEVRETVADSIIERMALYIPNIHELVVGRKIYSPLDLERVFGLTGGDVYHGKLTLDQLFAMRPHPRAAGYATPIAGLYLCGAGAHPGGGVSGAPGHNAARRVLEDLA